MLVLQMGGDCRWLHWAVELQTTMDTLFWDDKGGESSQSAGSPGARESLFWRRKLQHSRRGASNLRAASGGYQSDPVKDSFQGPLHPITSEGDGRLIDSAQDSRPLRKLLAQAATSRSLRATLPSCCVRRRTTMARSRRPRLSLPATCSAWQPSAARRRHHGEPPAPMAP